jgi:uncharacterized protein YjiS (DUF1127 family)
MTTLQSTRSAPLGSVATFGVVSFFERALDAFTAWRSARATAAELSRLSDKQLADIGLERAEIPDLARSLANR